MGSMYIPYMRHLFINIVSEQELKMDYIKIRFGDNFSEFGSEIEKTIEDMFQAVSPIFNVAERLWKPQMDMYETPEEVIITAEIAGVSKEKLEIGTARRLAYCFFITVLGFLIDWAYFELTWDTDLFNNAVWAPAMSQGLQFVWLLLPIAMIGLVNAALSYSFLELERKQAIIVGVVMGLFTAPWLLPTLPYWFGWVV